VAASRAPSPRLIKSEIGGPIGDYFDLIAGTSIGGILA
jgi:patatin-like phospholipase/acyl hydrolase